MTAHFEGGTVIPITFPTGYLRVSSSETPSTSYDAGLNAWMSYQTVAVGATGLSTISFITASVTGLPLNANVRLRPWSRQKASESVR